MSAVIIECPIWRAIMADERLAGARRKLSFHEIRLIIEHTRNALAAGSRRAKTPQAVECEASQSGGDSRNAQPLPPSPPSSK